MDELIRRRALSLFELTVDALIDDHGRDIHVEANKYAYLVLRGPKQYARTFNEIKLELDIEIIAEAFELWRSDIPGPNTIIENEISLIRVHNYQVQQLCSYDSKRPLNGAIRLV